MGVYIIGEISSNHGGSIDTIKNTLDAIKWAGADAAKIQTFTADTLTLNSNKECFIINQNSIWDGRTLYDLYSESYIPWEWHEEIFSYADSIGLEIFSTPFDTTAVDLLETLNVKRYKIASYEITDYPLIKYVASMKKPMIISTGIATIGEINDVVNICRNQGVTDITLLKCTSSYPSPYEDMNINMIKNLKDTFSTNVGLSDHSLGSEVALGAVALGAKVVEKHVILDKSIGGADSSFSMEIVDFKKMINQIRNLERALGTINYSLTYKTIKNREISRSLFFIKDIKKGDIITKENMKSIRPGFGMHPREYENILGKKTNCDIEKGTPVEWKYIND